MSRLEVKRWQGRAADLYDVLVEVANAGGLNQLPVPLVTRAMDQLTAYALDVAIDHVERAQEVDRASK
jgi:hypothetical protein